MERLLRKFETAKQYVPAPILKPAHHPTRFGVIHFGSTGPAMDEAAEILDADGIHVDTLRVRGFPFSHEVTGFIEDHEQVFVVEQNRDSQLRSLLLIECNLDPAHLVPIVHYDGTPITARFIARAIADQIAAVAGS